MRATDPAALDRVADLLARSAGLVFDVSRRPVLALAVEERMAGTGVAQVEQFLALVEDEHRGGDERQQLLDLVTVPETQFYRHAPHMAALRDDVLPGLVAAARLAGRGVMLWSAGCSTGEEAYTLALLLREALWAAGLPPDAGTVVATDVSTRALAAADRAVYGERSLRLLPADLLSELGPVPGGRQPSQALRRQVQLGHHNLVTQPPPFPRGSVDLVVCRNVTIYFDRETTRRVVEGFADVLRPDGRLLLGPSETLWRLTDRLVPEASGDVYLYRHPATSSPAPAAGRRSPYAALRRRPDGPRPGGAPSVARPQRRPDAATSPPAAADGLPEVDALLGAGAWEEAAGAALEVTRQQPLLPEAHFRHGLALVNTGRDGEALEALRRALYLLPDHGLAQVLLAGVHARRGDPLAARRGYRRAAVALRRSPPADVAGVLDVVDGDVDGLVEACCRLGRTP